MRTEGKEMNAVAGSRNDVDASGKERENSNRNRFKHVQKMSHLRAGPEWTDPHRLSRLSGDLSGR